MCDAIGAVLGQRKNKNFHAIHYASKVLNDAQTNYATTEKELLAIVYALEKFRSYLIGSKIVVILIMQPLSICSLNPTQSQDLSVGSCYYKSSI